jgi:hypothetical protein
MCSNFSIVFLSPCVVDPCGSVAARRIPAGCRAKLSVSNPSHPHQRVAERRNSRARNAAPVGPSYDRTCPSSGRELPVHNADRRAFRRSTAAFSLDLETAFWRRTGAPIRTPLIPRAFTRFHPLHQPVAGRTHVVGPGDVSRDPRRPDWLGRTLRRRPCSANKRHRLAPSTTCRMRRTATFLLSIYRLSTFSSNTVGRSNGMRGTTIDAQRIGVSRPAQAPAAISTPSAVIRDAAWLVVSSRFLTMADGRRTTHATGK